MMDRLVEWIGLRAARDRAIEDTTLDMAAARCQQFVRWYCDMNHMQMAVGAGSCYYAILKLKEKGDEDGNG